MYYDGANWKWDKGDKMIDANFAKQIISDLDRIKETLQEIQGSGKVEKKEPCHPENHPLSNVDFKTRCDKCGNYYEKKEQRKLADILSEHIHGLTSWSISDICPIAIDAVIECYVEWEKVPFNYPKSISFPEYLKEKML